jgi:hypothetical protein
MRRLLGLPLLLGLACVVFSGQPGGPADAIVGAGNLPPQPATLPSLAGHVVGANAGLSRIFVPYERVLLRAGERVVAETSTDAHGGFVFYARLTDGRYDIAVESERYDGKLALVYRGAPLTKLEVVVKAKEPR